MSKVDAGYTEIHTGQGTASEDLEGKVVLRRTSRKIKEVISYSQLQSVKLTKVCIFVCIV